jgi:hypothetical protein
MSRDAIWAWMVILRHPGLHLLYRAWHVLQLRTTDLDLNRDTCKSWIAGIKPPTDHRHLVKSHAVLDGSQLRVYPTGHRFAGTILVPMFRPDPMGRPDTLELCGVQHLMPKVAFNTDKIMAKGSHTGGAFVPFQSLIH